MRDIISMRGLGMEGGRGCEYMKVDKSAERALYKPLTWKQKKRFGGAEIL